LLIKQGSCKGNDGKWEYTGPVLEFTEGEYAIIYVNEMGRNVHPLARACFTNFYDGVPYLNTPPIKPGQTLKYEFPINQSGTYWYHSHTMLQEQRSVWIYCYSSQKETLVYDKVVLMLSDGPTKNR
jgi:FtsP/CotA-like multicopper oxidase with cupredoxin domain